MRLSIVYFNILSMILTFAFTSQTSEDSIRAIGYAAKAIAPEYGGVLSGKSSIITALSKVIHDEHDEGKRGLYDAVVTMTNYILRDRFLYMVGHDAIDLISRRKQFSETRIAIENYSETLFSKLFKESGPVNKTNVLKHMNRAMFHVHKAFGDELYKLPSKSSAMKYFKKFNTWLKNNDLTNMMVSAFDVIALRTNLRLLQDAIFRHNVEKIAANCLGICAGMVGLDDFVSAVTSQIQILDGKGPLVGALLNVAVTFMKIHDNRKMQAKGSVKKVTYESKSVIESLGETSKRQLDRMMSHISNQDIELNDVYIANKGMLPKWGLLYNKDRGPLHFGAFEDGSIGDSPLYRKHDSSDVFLIAGRPRRVVKANQPKGDEETKIMGFDFYGTFAKDYPYKGSTIFVSTDGIHTSDYRLNGLRINTCLQKPWFHPNDHLLLSDMSNLDQGERIEVHMGKGDDVLVINGMFGTFSNETKETGNGAQGILDIDLGSGLNTLSFEGMSRNRKDIEGIFFDRKDNKLSYFHGKNAKLHTVGIIKFVHVLIGSPFTDYVILSGGSDGNPNGNDFTVVQHEGGNFYEVDLDQSVESSMKSRFRVIDNSRKAPTIVIRTSGIVKRNNLVFSGNVFRIYRKKSHEAKAENIVSIHIISRNVPYIKVVDKNDNTLINDVRANLLAPEYVTGLSMVTKSHTMVNGTGDDDICVLECKMADSNQNEDLVTIDLQGGDDKIVLKDSTFLQPCEINDKDFNVWLDPQNDGNETENWYIYIEDKTNGAVMKKYLLKGVEKIVNAFGSLIIDLMNEKKEKVDLLSTFISVTTHELGLFK